MIDILGELVGSALGSELGAAVLKSREKRLWERGTLECSMRALSAGSTRMPTRWLTGIATVGPSSVDFAANVISGLRLFRRAPIHLTLATLDLRDPRRPTAREQMTLALSATAIVRVATTAGDQLEWALPIALAGPIVDRLKD